LSGDNCEHFVPARCDEDPSWPRELVGVQYKSRCAGECDLTAAKCRCGRGTHVGGWDANAHTTASGDQKSAPPTSTTPQPKNGTAYAGPYAPGDTPMSKYPDRPMQQCYYEGILKDRAWHRNLAWDRWRGAPAESFWQLPKNIPQTNWCSLDPSGDGTTHVEPAVRCTCFDGYFGDGCAERVKQFCLNDCSGFGSCGHGEYLYFYLRTGNWTDVVFCTQGCADATRRTSAPIARNSPPGGSCQPVSGPGTTRGDRAM
jgi:hypothetical protein